MEEKKVYDLNWDTRPDEIKSAMHDLWMTGMNDSVVWVRYRDVETTVNKIIEICKKEYGGAQLYLRDNGGGGGVHKYGTNQHDSLILDPDGRIRYYNLQNGTGTRFPSEGYSFCYKDGQIPSESDLDSYEFYLDIGGDSCGFNMEDDK